MVIFLHPFLFFSRFSIVITVILLIIKLESLIARLSAVIYTTSFDLSVLYESGLRVLQVFNL